MNSNLNPQQFFHGTSHDLQPGDVVTGQSDLPHGYATSDVENARYYAERSARRRNSAYGLAVHRPKVYAVEPVGEHEPDPWDEPEFGSVRSLSGFRVQRVVE